ncbi:immunoglobulin-like domain-containing protein [Paenibacillus prosopidis]|uniref:Concanavalin A-like lectin/glucanase superfamily protein n=1 Tax=Paenibacillus prosopidis TaxID=630520 RepID=A0A368W9D1_9BACL|nr:immunoglobulin-like domain-containing protein [Paenibacillus prosopidis]RCW51686.1 concanavalin A-like lectin/glucanase superfamily protein [Paenibacillus prosopidis]
MKSIPALSKMVLALLIVLSSVMPTYAVSAEDALVTDSAPAAAVSSTVLLEDDFQDGDSNGWTLSGGTGAWSVADDAAAAGNKMLYQSLNGPEAYAIAGDSSWSSYVYETKVKLVNDGPYPGIVARYTDNNNYYMFRLNPTSINKLELSKKVSGTSTTLGSSNFTTVKGKWYTMRMVVDGNTIRCYIDGTRIFSITDNSLAAGKVGFRTNWGQMGVDDIQVRSLPDPKPAAPSNVQAAEATASTVALSWDGTVGASTYRVYRSTQADANFIQVYNGSAASFRDTGLNAETTYYYRVTAELDGYETADSATVSTITKASAAAPTGLKATAKSENTISLSWDAVTGAGSYSLYRATNASGPFTTPFYSGPATEVSDSGLSSGVTYYYTVSYSDANDESQKSAVINETTTLVLPASPDLLPGIVAAYPFNESTGTTAAPTSTSSNQAKASLINGAVWTTGRTGGAVDLDGTNDHVLLPAGIMKDLNEMTIATWVKQDTLKSWARVFDMGLGTSNYIFLTTGSGNGDTRFVLKNGGSEQLVSKSPAQQTAGKWKHYAMTLSRGTAILYVDGTEVARNSNVTIKPSDFGSTSLNYIGRSLFSADPYLDGKIDDFYIFNRALGPAEVAFFTTQENKANVEADTAALTLGDTSAVMTDLQLPLQGPNGSSISWQSDNASVISPSGAVARPALGEEDAVVVLTAAISQGNASQSKSFTVTVLAELSDADAVAADKAALKVANANAVTAKLTLPVSGLNDTVISWKSDHEVNLRPDGMVSRPPIGAGDLNVTLTAKITRGSVTETRDFVITIHEQDEFTGYLFAYTKGGTLYYAVSRNGRTWTELSSNAGVTAIAGQNVFKLLSEDKWYKYEYVNSVWSLYSSKDLTGSWTKEAASFFSLPAGALEGSFKLITEAEWSSLVHRLSTPRTLDVLKVTTKAGFSPRLSELVKIDYTNNLYTTLEVEWDAIDASKYAAVGTFTAAGTVKGTSTRVQAAVTVIDDSAYSATIRNGEFWYDTEGGMIQAHGGHIIKVEDTYYWFGEDKGHNSAVLKGVSVYASKDLKTWEFRNTVLTTASHPELASSKIERPKVLYNEKTGKYVLWGHWEEAGNYNQANVIVAVSDTVDGDYTYVNRFQPGGMQSRDFTVFQDDDGTAYLFSSSNNNADMNVFQLTDDYLYTDHLLYTLFPGGKRESPAIVKKDGVYYMFTSGLSGWYPNQGMYTSTTNLKDKAAWSSLKPFGDPSTYYTQASFIVNVYGSETTSYVYVGDRWNPSALMNSQYIWLPLQLDNGVAELGYSGEWDLNAATGRFETPKDLLVSQDKPVTASSAASGYPASAANDGRYDNFFDSGSTSFPQTWRVDLGREFDLIRVDLSWREWNGSEIYYTYKIEGSNDDQNFTLLVDQSGNRTTSFNSHKLTGKYRYVKLTILGQYGHTNNANNPVTWYRGLHEVKIYTSDMKLDTPQGLTAMPVITSAASKEATSVNVKWQAVPNAARYVLYRSDDLNGTYAEVYDGRAIAFGDNGLTNDETYYYKVKAVHPGGESEISEAVAVKTFSVPDNLEVYDNTIEMKWQDEAGNTKIFPTLKAGSTYYYYEYERDSDGFKQINVQTSEDGENWSAKQVVLTRASHPDLAACKFEGLSFTYNEETGKVVAWMHYENNKDYTLGRAASMSGDPGEELTFHGSFRPNGNDSRDIAFFKDDDGTGYIISSGNTNSDLFLYQLSDDYITVERQVAKIHEGKHREAPSMIKKDGIYYLFTSEAAGWYPSKGMYASASSIEGPWSELRSIGNSSTFSAQSGGVSATKGTEATSYFMHANRWLHGWASQATGSRQRWLPISLNNGYASFDYYDQVLFNRKTGVVVPVQDGILLSEGKPAYAQDGLESNRASKANDGDYYTSWVSASATWPKWWMVDLGDNYNLRNIQISWYLHKGSEGYPKYKIETSTDGINFTTALDRTDNLDYGFTSDKLTGQARYVRVQLVDAVLHNNPNNWYTPHLSEVKVFGTPLDKTAPVTAATVQSKLPNGANGWYTSDVKLTLTAEDGDEGEGVELTEYRLNGGEWTAYTEPVTLSEEGKTIIDYRSADKAGNVEEAKSLEVKIDLTAPVVQITGAALYTIDQTVTLTCSATDVISSVYGTPCAKPLLQVKAYTLASGQNTATVTAKDMAGHGTTATHTFTVKATFDSLKTVTTAFLQSKGAKGWDGIAKSLNYKLDQAKAAAGRGNTAAVKDLMTSYIGQVSDQIGYSLTKEQADILIRWAQTLI